MCCTAKPGRSPVATRCRTARRLRTTASPSSACLHRRIGPQWPPGLSSSHFHDRVKVGDVLKVRAPSGHFFIDPDPAVPAVLIAGGIGITPMMSMLSWCQAKQPGRTVHLYYGLRNGGDHAFKGQLEQFARENPRVKLNIVYSRPASTDRPGDDFQHTGHVDLALLQRTLPHGRHQFYICGPAAMMDTLVPSLAEWGAPDQDIHFEAFGPASVRKSSVTTPPASVAGATGVNVRFNRSGRELAWSGQDSNLLDFAERHGLTVDSGCRSGGCGSCETRLVSGSVVYDRRPDHDISPGCCLLCVGRPESPLVLEA